MMEGVDRNAAITLDIDDKVCALVEADTVQNKTECIIRGVKSLILQVRTIINAPGQKNNGSGTIHS